MSFLKRMRADLGARRELRIRYRALAILVASIAGFALAVLLEEGHYLIALVPALFLAGAALLEFVVADVLVDERYPPDTKRMLDRLQIALDREETADAIVAALETCVQSFRACDRESVSAAAHLRIELIRDEKIEPALVQITDYTSTHLGGKSWRLTDATQGVIGRCLRTGEVEWVNFRDRSEYLTRMVAEFGFSSEEAQRHTTSARSYLAFPVEEGDRVAAVLYFFSTEPQVFPYAAREDQLSQAGQEVLNYLKVARVFNP